MNSEIVLGLFCWAAAIIILVGWLVAWWRNR